jgi:hypothetical protein
VRARGDPPAAAPSLKEIEQRNAAFDEKTRMLESLSVRLAKYLSPQVYGSIFAGSRDVELATERKRLTVFFSGIKDFVATTADMQAEDLTAMLTDISPQCRRSPWLMARTSTNPLATRC